MLSLCQALSTQQYHNNHNQTITNQLWTMTMTLILRMLILTCGWHVPDSLQTIPWFFQATIFRDVYRRWTWCWHEYVSAIIQWPTVLLLQLRIFTKSKGGIIRMMSTVFFMSRWLLRQRFKIAGDTVLGLIGERNELYNIHYGWQVCNFTMWMCV